MRGLIKDKKEYLHKLVDEIDLDTLPIDNHGQVILYTYMYRWKDETYRDHPDLE